MPASPTNSQIHHNERVSQPDFSGVRAVFFDLDDTLCAYWEAAAVGLRKTFKLAGPEGFSAEDMVHFWAVAFRKFSKTIKGSGWYEGYLKSGEPTRIEQMRLTLLEAGIDDLALARKLSDTYFVERDKALCLFPEALEVLKFCEYRYPLGLITNGPADIQRQEIDTLQIEKYFRFVLIEGEMGEGKPLLSVFRRAEALAGCPAEAMLFVGNSFNHDMAPAMEAGWKTAWVRRPSDVPPSSKGETNEPEPIPTDRPLPDLIMGDLRELIPLLDH